VYIRNDKSLYDAFYKSKEDIENAIGSELEWMELPDATASRVLLIMKCNPKDKNQWQTYFKWCITTAEKFSITFKAYI
jgi:hypothetical protein